MNYPWSYRAIYDGFCFSPLASNIFGSIGISKDYLHQTTSAVHGIVRLVVFDGVIQNRLIIIKYLGSCDSSHNEYNLIGWNITDQLLAQCAVLAIKLSLSSEVQPFVVIQISGSFGNVWPQGSLRIRLHFRLLGGRQWPWRVR